MQYVAYGKTFPMAMGPARSTIKGAIEDLHKVHEGVELRSVHIVDPNGEIHNKAVYIPAH